jgi:hypothetical protein
MREERVYHLIDGKAVSLESDGEKAIQFRCSGEVSQIVKRYELAGLGSSLKPQERKRLRRLLYLRPTAGRATAPAGSGGGLTGLGREFAL